MGATIENKSWVDGVLIVRLRAEAGYHINEAVNNALKILQSEQYAHEKDIVEGTMKFNDIELKMKPFDTLEMVRNDFQKQSDERRAAYLKSPEYAEAEKRREESRRATQKTMDATWPELVKILRDHVATRKDPNEQVSGDIAPRLMQLMKDYILAADHIGVNAEHDRVKDALIDAGYKENEWVGTPKEAFENNNHMCRAYTMGQVINYLNVHHCIHPAVTCFIDRSKLNIHP